MNHLIAELQREQESQGLSDRQLALRLKVSQATLSVIKSGKRKDISSAFLRAVVREFPQLWPAVIDFLSGK